MASGGHKSKSSASEPRHRSSWQRTTSMSDKEDNISLNSMPNELRPNNWDFSDWRPSSQKDQTKRRKKGNPEWEREQTLSQDSPPPSERQHGTPRTFPRTKITPSTPTSQRQALEQLRQHMTFSDQDDGVSNDGERNNERNLLKHRENYTRQDMSSTSDSQLTRPVSNRRDDRNNRNNNKQNHNEARSEGKPDSSQIVGRLMQIRDYIKQASSMMDSLRKSGDPKDMMRYVDQSQMLLIWRKKESECLDKLHRHWPGYREEMTRLQKLMDHLREQERGYTGLLQNILSVREETGINDVGRDLTPNLETMDDTQSIDLDVQSEVSESRPEERSVSASSRPRIEDVLGLTSDCDDEETEEQAPSESSDQSDSNMDDTVISGRKNHEWDFELGEEELAMGGVANPKEAAETLTALKQQQELLTKLVEQQEQMRALRGRQAALLALQQDAEQKLTVAKKKSTDARSYSNDLEAVASTMTGHAEDLLSSQSNTGRQSDPELHDLKQQLQFLRNELKSQNQNLQQAQSSQSNLAVGATGRGKETRSKNLPPPRPPSPKFAAPAPSRPTQQPQFEMPADDMGREELHAKLQELLGKRDKLDQLLQEEMTLPLLPQAPADLNRDDLQNKLLELQAKKSRMDDMLNELHVLRDNPMLLLNNAQPPAAIGASQVLPPGPRDLSARRDHGDGPRDLGAMAIENAEGAEQMAGDVVEMLEARQKLQKLNEVKDRLSKMKSLVHYYQSVESSSGRPVEQEDQSSLPAYSDYGGETGETAAELDAGYDRRGQPQTQHGRKVMQESSKPKVNIPVQEQEQSDENNSSSSSDGESQLSSLGPWGDDPEIQEKIRKLKDAKDKLKRLQSLVAMVQQTPDVANDLPDNIAEIAASIEDVESQITLQTEDRNNASTSDGEVHTQADRDSYYQSKMTEQMAELDQLKDEKTHLLTIQTQLQTLHQRFQQTEGSREPDEDADVDETRPKSSKSKRPANNNRQPQPTSNNQQQSTGPSVTFSSNEEVYDKMRKQRMLREELRDKKKQLESIMKKDRNKKQYYKNQDNQSDTVSYTTDAFGASASADATMATWGGSTVDNLESITEDGAVQDNDDDDEDAYPSDGILQVEEEEEENQSDNETYTIEEDVRQRRKARAAMVKANNTDTSNRKTTKRSFPRPAGRQAGATRPKEAWTEPADFNKWSRNSNTGRKSKQENYRTAEEIVRDDDDDDDIDGSPSSTTLESLQKKLEQTSLLCQSLLGEQQAPAHIARQTSTGYGMPDLQQQLQQQQLMMSLNQCYQQIQMQQLDMQNMQRQMQSMAYQFADNANDSTLSADNHLRPMSSMFSPMLPRQSPNLLLPTEAFPFSPVPVFQQNLSPAVNRLLRRADDESEPAEPIERERQRNLSSRLSRQSQSRPETYSQKAKKKSQSPNQQQRDTQGARPKTSTSQSYQEEELEQSGMPPDRLKFEQYLARKKREFLERNKLSDRSPQKSDSGPRRSSKTRTSAGPSNVDNPLYRPGLSAGISGAGYTDDGRSVASSVQSSVAAMAHAINSQAETRGDIRESDDPNEMSLFETLRETIYSEVATLISQNENRPHYLIELFRELQRLTSDYLRQRVLYDIKDVVSKYLVEETAIAAPPPPWMNTAANNFATASELTPSESLVTSDDEEVKTKLKEKVAANLVAKERKRAAKLLRCGSLKDDTYDYQEVPEMASSVSTPSNSYWESPFNQDSLGETAIHLDKTLERMREYEKRMGSKDAKTKSTPETRTTTTSTADMPGSSSAMDMGSESSVTSDSVPYPRIDTQQLDQQIKAIMTEVIPVIKEHMDHMCSPQLLAYIKRLVLSLTRQYDGGQEFARFFHRQLGSILQDTLAKYEGRKMRECGEDLLVDMSEVLFNELAFFRLMQDLDDPIIAEKMQKAQDFSGSEEEDDEEDDDESKDKEEDSDDMESDCTESTANVSDTQADQDDTKATYTEEEDLGKARDDEFANEMEILQDAEDKDEDPESPFKIELAPSETKPYTRIGSDEDDESADDESENNEDPSETAVSINARRVNYILDDGEDDATQQDGTAVSGVMEGSEGKDQGQDADQGAGSSKTTQESHSTSTEHMNGDVLAMNGDMNGDLDDMEVITMDDLPETLTVMSQAELAQKLALEHQENTGAAVVLGSIDGQDELAGDPEHLKSPDESSA